MRHNLGVLRGLGVIVWAGKAESFRTMWYTMLIFLIITKKNTFWIGWSGESTYFRAA